VKFLVATAVMALATPAAQNDLLQRAADPNPTLKSYTASAQLSATLHAVIAMHRTYNGTVYYLRPRRKIAFENVSGPLSRFKELTASTPTYDQAVAQYTITPLGDDGTLSRYSLVPKTSGGRVKSLEVKVDDKSALVVHAQWSYTNGGTLSFDESYIQVGDYHLPSKATIAARFPGYNVDGTLTFSGYKPGAEVSPSVFESGS
jgi:hypothetical protein